MTGFGVSILLIAALVAPGVLFIGGFSLGSSIKRASIGFGPAADVPIFLAASLTVVGVFGGIAEAGLAYAGPCGRVTIGQFVIELAGIGGAAPASPDCVLQHWSTLTFEATGLLCACAMASGWLLVGVLEAFVPQFPVHAFPGVASALRRRNAVVCSVLCQYGPAEGRVLLTGYLTALTVGAGRQVESVLLSDPERAALVMTKRAPAGRVTGGVAIDGLDQLLVAGERIENVGFEFLVLAAPGWWRREAAKALVLLLMVAGSIGGYAHVAPRPALSMGAQRVRPAVPAGPAKHVP